MIEWDDLGEEKTRHRTDTHRKSQWPCQNVTLSVRTTGVGHVWRLSLTNTIKQKKIKSRETNSSMLLSLSLSLSPYTHLSLPWCHLWQWTLCNDRFSDEEDGNGNKRSENNNKITKSISLDSCHSCPNIVVHLSFWHFLLLFYWLAFSDKNCIHLILTISNCIFLHILLS